MSAGSPDWYAGLQASSFAHSRDIAEWSNYSAELQAELHQLSARMVKAESGRRGFAALARLLLAELKRLDPLNPLLSQQAQLDVVNHHMAKSAAELGYAYDPKTDRICRLRR